MVEIISIEDLFSGATVSELKEMTLTTLFDSSRESEEYPVEGHDSRLSTFKQRQDHVSAVALSRMSLRTFSLKLSAAASSSSSTTNKKTSTNGDDATTTTRVVVPLDETEYLRSGKRAPTHKNNNVNNNNNNNKDDKKNDNVDKADCDADDWRSKAKKAEIERIRAAELANKYRTESERWKDRALLHKANGNNGNNGNNNGQNADGSSGKSVMNLVYVLPIATLAVVGVVYTVIRRNKTVKHRD
jgi:hypothetical protein